ncbi:MAG: hypothetical protein H0U86_15375 [Chloroflexi bacterium]|nr:hypothetical protein [Chloroflexota bacterium]
MELSAWLDEYRNFDPTEVTRKVAEPVDDWEDEELLAPADRVRDTGPRWLDRAGRVGYAPATHI